MSVAVELYAHRHVLLGVIDTGRGRLSDYLNDATIDVVPLDHAWIGDLMRPEVLPGHLTPASFRKQDILLAAALDSLDPRAARPGYVHTTAVQIVASVGPYLVTGGLHLPPGTRFDPRRLFGVGTRPFVPLTQARVTHQAYPRANAAHGAVLLRSDRVEFAGLLAAEDASTVAPLAAVLHEHIRSISGAAPKAQH
jgi:hypothetical protein